MKHHMRRLLVVGGLVLGFGDFTPHVGLASGPVANTVPARVFDAALPRLSGARIPIYLPSWLPAFVRHAYPIVGVADQGRSYFAYLSSVRSGGGDASLLFTLDARSGPADRQGRTVVLRRGLLAHLDRHAGGNRGPTISWAIGRYSYEIGYLSSEAQLIRAARSMVRVHPLRYGLIRSSRQYSAPGDAVSTTGSDRH